MGMAEYVVRLTNSGGGDMWLAPWQGDPGRTFDKASAVRFKTKAKAVKALEIARQFRPKLSAVIDPTEAE
jgi:hypothetical protein